MTTARQGLGARGELLAAAELQRLGYTIRATHWRCRFGEIDLVAEDAAGLAFVEVRTRRGDLFVAGLDSFWAGRPSLTDALRDWRPGLPLLLLVHEPDGADKIAPRGIAGLQLSGHTHGGQVCLPGPRPIPLHVPSWGKKYKHGLHRVGALQLYVNRGIGCVGVPLRIGCPPEVTELTLRSPELLRA